MFEIQQNLTQLENKKESLEAENQELLLRKEQLNGELQRIRWELGLEVSKGLWFYVYREEP